MNLFIFLFGLMVGSFLNCVIYRLEMRDKRGITSFSQGRPQRKAFGFLRGKSFCPYCKHTLYWQDLIPVFSFLFLRGKCRYCSKRISWQYPLVEIATGILFLLISLSVSDTNTLIYLMIIGCFLIIIFVYDLKHFIIPDKIIYPAIAITFLYRLFEILNFGHWDLIRNLKLEIRNFEIFLNPLLAGLAAGTFFLVIVLGSRGRWMGVGDIKLAFLMGLLLGFPYILNALFFSFLIGAIIGIGLILAKRKTMKSEVPFGPFLVIGTFIALFLGEIIISWYWNLFI